MLSAGTIAAARDRSVAAIFLAAAEEYLVLNNAQEGSAL